MTHQARSPRRGGPRSAIPAAVSALAIAMLLTACRAPEHASPAAGGAGDAARARSSSELVTVVLVRHAETESSTHAAGDPALSDAGRERAHALAHMLADAGVSALFATEFERTQATLAPLAEACRLDVAVVPARDPEQLVARLRALPAGALAVVAGHSNTVPAVARALGGKLENLELDPRHGELLPHAAYDRLIVVTTALEAAPGTSVDPLEPAARTLALRYGAPTPADGKTDSR